MLHEITPPNYSYVASLFEPLAIFNVAIKAALDGNNWGYVLADDPQNPASAMMHTVEGTHLVGHPTASFANALNRYLHEYYFTETRQTLYTCLTEDWIPRLETLFAPYTVRIELRQHFVCTTREQQVWQSQLAEAYSLHPINHELLADTTLHIPDRIHNWINANWGSQQNYLQEGFGTCIKHNNRIICWSLADCKSGTSCEIGIHTHTSYRRQGLAAITTAACTDDALKNGFAHVGWHCNADNVGSWKTAEKAGFVKERDYKMYYCSTKI